MRFIFVAVVTTLVLAGFGAILREYYAHAFGYYFGMVCAFVGLLFSFALSVTDAN